MALTALPDNLVEGDETVVLTISSGGSIYTIGTAVATAIITDDPPVVSMAATDTIEGGIPGNFRISRTGGNIAAALAVGYTVGGTATSGDDYTPLSGSVTIAAGETFADASIEALADNRVEGTETVTLTVVPTNSHVLPGGASSATATATITDDPPVISLRPSTATEGGTNGNVRFTRTGGNLAAPLTVQYVIGGTATSGDDYTPLSGSVTILAGDADADVSIEALADNLVEGIETLTLQIFPTSTYLLFGDSTNETAIVPIIDDPPVVSVAAIADAEEGGADGVFEFTRTGGDLTKTLTVAYTVGGTATSGDDYTALSKSVTFAANETTANVTVAAVDDLIVEDDETVTVGASAGTGNAVGSPEAAALTIKDNDVLKAVNDNYQLSDDGTLTLTANEGVLVNDRFPAGVRALTHAQLHEPLDPAIGTVFLSSDGGFSIFLTPAANASPAPVQFRYDLVDAGLSVVGTAVVKAYPAIANFVWFHASSVTFDPTDLVGSKYQPIVSDNGNLEYSSQQWSDKDGDGIPDAQNPVRFVRNNRNTVQVTTIVLDPTLVSNVDPSKFKLTGTIQLNGTTFTLQSAEVGSKLADDKWKFTSVTLAPGSAAFPSVAYYPNLTIQWTATKTDGQAIKMNSGQTNNPTYVTYANVQPTAKMPPGTTFKMLRTFVALGSTASNELPMSTTAEMTAAVWSQFSSNMVSTWESKPLVYYKRWDYYNLTELELTKSEGLVNKREGNCASFAKLFIDALRAQGIENTNDLYWIQPKIPDKIGDPRVMFVGGWTAKAGTGGAPRVVVPGFPALGAYKFWNATNVERGWDKDTKKYSWGEGAANDVVAPATTNSQNNTNPLGIFNTHVLVKIQQGSTITLYDPSYGTTAAATATNGSETAANAAVKAALKTYEDQAISYYGLYSIKPRIIVETPGTPGKPFAVTYLMKSNPTYMKANPPANAEPNLIRVAGNSTDY